MKAKSLYRKILLEKRKTLFDVQKEKRLLERLRRFLDELPPYGSIALFYPFEGELDLKPLVELELSRNKTVVFPKIKDETMFFSAAKSLLDFQPGFKGIMEPVGDQSVDRIDVMVAPGVGYNARKYRLGYGGGYYDKFLSKNRPSLVLGCFYSYLEMDFEEENHDVPLDVILTEEGLF